MKKEIIISTDDTLGGTPRLRNRRLDVFHVIDGVNYSSKSAYKSDFLVSDLEISHAIMYCKEEICELHNVPQCCYGCSKKFRNDSPTWEDFCKENDIDGNISEDGTTVFLGDLEDYKKHYEGIDAWKVADKLYMEYREELNLPYTYEQLISITRNS
ncbi:MAG: hypothetical protein NXI20_18260 [bacterium]|nr:hypothetical protein [bacterium]